ncbi:MAG: response regulator [Gammaproteobacteria bacterium]|nr:response regulator [Gammaproteobacteria bacterium]
MTQTVRVIGRGPVVLVDDSVSDAYLAQRCFERSKLDNEFKWLESGPDLLDYLAEVKDGDAEMPALVLLDINMPGMDGYDALAAVRGTPGFEHVPIIMMLTNSNDPQDRDKATSMGANGFYTKPADIHDYVAYFDSLTNAAPGQSH